MAVHPARRFSGASGDKGLSHYLSATYRLIPQNRKWYRACSLRCMEQEIRPYKNDYWPQLAATAHHNWTEIDVLQTVLAELKYRKNRKAARELRVKVTERLVDLSVESFPWPKIAVVPGIEALQTDHWSYSDGLLSFMGYRVGQKGAYRSERQHILDYVYNERLPNVESTLYMKEWGTPKTGVRLHKLAASLASFIRMAKRKKTADMGLAISEWEEDLAFLKPRYYDGRYDRSFRWPRERNGHHSNN